MLGFIQSAFAISERCNFNDPIDIRMKRMDMYNALGDKRHPFKPKNNQDIETVKELVSYLEECKEVLLKGGKKEMVDSLPDIKSKLDEFTKLDEQVKTCPQLYECQKNINDSDLLRHWLISKQYDLIIFLNEDLSIIDKEKRIKILEDYFNKCSCAISNLKFDEQFTEYKKIRESIKKEYDTYLESEKQKKVEYEREALENEKAVEVSRRKKEEIDKLANTSKCKKTLVLLDYCKDVENLNSLKEAQKQEHEIEKRSGVSNPSKKRDLAQESIIIENIISKHLKEYNSYKENVLGLNICKTARAEDGSLNHFLTKDSIKKIRESLKVNCGTSDYLPE